MARQLGRLGAQASARRAGAGARHASAERCDTAGSPATRPAGAHDTAACALKIRPWRLATHAGQGARGAGQSARGTARRGAHGALQHGGWGCDTAGGLGHDTARPAHDTAGRARALACQCAPGRACWACWVLLHPAWFFELVFDSVIFLSHRLDPDHEHCS